MGILRALRALLVATAVFAAGAAGAYAAEAPAYPHEQQARLRDVEDQVVDVQRELFTARQRQDTTAIENLGKKLNQLQRERKQLIRATQNQLPSQ